MNSFLLRNGHICWCEITRIEVENVLFYGKKGPVFPRTDGQKDLVKSFLKNDIIISVGPAGTGKTFLAVNT